MNGISRCVKFIYMNKKRFWGFWRDMFLFHWLFGRQRNDRSCDAESQCPGHSSYGGHLNDLNDFDDLNYLDDLDNHDDLNHFDDFDDL